MRILRKLKHENIISMLDSFESLQEFCVVTEFTQGELFEILWDDTCLPDEQVQAIAKQLFLDKMKRPLYGKHPMAKFSWTVTEETDTIEWCNRCQDALNNVERLYQGKDTADVIQQKVLQFLNLKNDDLKLFAEKDLKSGDFNGFHTVSQIHLLETIVGGEGVRTEHSLPNVEKTIGAVAEDEAEDHLQEAIQEKFAVLGEVNTAVKNLPSLETVVALIESSIVIDRARETSTKHVDQA
ncbi:hypothetical protein OROGR_023350 [Orobanche gracilis]